MAGGITGGLGNGFGRLWMAVVLSRLGDGIYEIGLMMLVYRETDSPRKMAFTLLMYMLPIMLFSLFGGVVVDRVKKRGLMISCDIIRALLLLVIPASMWAGFFSVGLVWAVTFCLSSVAQFFNPAASALLPSLVPKDGLVNANSRLSAGSRAMEILGPVIGGILAASSLGAVSAVWLNGISFVVSALLISGIDPSADKILRVLPHPPQIKANPLQELREGLAFVAGNPWMLLTLMLSFIANSAMGPMSAVLPIYSLKILHAGPNGYGYLAGALSLGCVLGSLAANKATARLGTQFTAALGTVVMALGFSLSVLARDIMQASAFMAVVGAGVSIVSIPVVSRIQQVSPAPLLGRVFGAVNMVCALAMPMGTVLVGSVLAEDTVDPIFIVSSMVLLLSGIVYASGYRLPEAKSGMAA